MIMYCVFQTKVQVSTCSEIKNEEKSYLFFAVLEAWGTYQTPEAIGAFLCATRRRHPTQATQLQLLAVISAMWW